MSILNKDKAINNGALFENVVAQELLAKGFKEHYFNSKEQGKKVYLPIYMIMFLEEETLEQTIYRLDLHGLEDHS